ncbi:baeRF12 domain-containing protein [Acidimangrovimonas sediminis]|uniref:baeRF12 domain-containing protein n=1 Tax=Acidimangrovimonas sediminis TaxID=2056283 RepID=UPI00130484DD|nr:host attachment protein [Acidimangrovimonas sediminis]
MTADILWILVMNTSRAQILRGIAGNGPGRPRRLVLRAEQRRMAALLGAPEISLPVSPPRPATGRPIWLRAIEADQISFMKRVIDLLETHRVAGDFNRLAIFAAPKVLQRLRSAMPRRLRALVVAEIAENVVDLSYLAMRLRVAARLRERGISEDQGS